MKDLKDRKIELLLEEILWITKHTERKEALLITGYSLIDTWTKEALKVFNNPTHTPDPLPYNWYENLKKGE